MVDQVIQNLDILYNVTGQSLVFDCPEGRPSSVTSSAVYPNHYGDDDTAEDALDSTASIETNPDTTFDAASGDGQSDPRICNIAATTGIATGRRYLLTNATGETEWAEVRAITSAVSVQTRFPLRNAYANADTFESTRITHALDATWIADKTNISPVDPNPHYRWRLEYVVDSVTYVAQVFFDLVRASGTTTVTGLDVDGAYPWLGWMHRLSSEDMEDGGARVIAEAYRQVKLKMSTAGRADEAARNREVIDDLVIHRAAELVAGMDVQAIEIIRLRFDESYNNFIIGAQTPFAATESGAASTPVKSTVFRR